MYIENDSTCITGNGFSRSGWTIKERQDYKGSGLLERIHCNSYYVNPFKLNNLSTSGFIAIHKLRQYIPLRAITVHLTLDPVFLRCRYLFSPATRTDFSHLMIRGRQ